MRKFAYYEKIQQQEKTSSAHQSSVLIFLKPLLLLSSGMMKQMNNLQLKGKGFLPKLLFVVMY
jgi:hypothetical protein